MEKGVEEGGRQGRRVKMIKMLYVCVLIPQNEHDYYVLKIYAN